MKCIIKVEQAKHMANTRQAREDFAVIYGQDTMLRNPVFWDMEAAERYCDIVGGIAYPSVSAPGVVIVIGIVLSKGLPIFKVLEAAEESEVFALFQTLLQLRMIYGFGKDARILPMWIGDPDKFQPLVSRTSVKLEEKHGEGQGLYIKPPVDFGEKHSFPLYIRQLFRSRNLQLRNPAWLDLNGHQNISTYAQAIRQSDAENGKYDDFPMVGLLGGMMHTILTQRPWLETTKAGQAFNLED
jgi:hypothetical protein